MGSSRLPGKVLRDLGGVPALQRVIERVRRAKQCGRLWVATSAERQDDAVFDLCQELDVDCFRGSESDVLDRYYQCARQAGAEVIVRITGDTPLLAPDLFDLAVELQREQQADYVELAGLPRGVSVEAISMAALAAAWEKADCAADREHVTTYILERPDEFRVLLPPAPPELRRPDLRLTLDTPSDLHLITSIYTALGERIHEAPLEEIIRLVDTDPELGSLAEEV